MYYNQDYEVILNRMLDSLPDDVDKRQGGVLYDLLAPIALELSFAYFSMSNILQYGVANTEMPSEYLELRVGEVGLTRKPSIQATGQVGFSGDPGQYIASGTRLSSYDVEDPIYFTTTEGVTLDVDGLGTADAICEYGGVLGNVGVGVIENVVGDLAGIVQVLNIAAFTGGYDEESDYDLLMRYLEKVRKPATGGNVYQYEQWALEVAGVGGSKAYDADSLYGRGPGSVRVVIIDSNKRSITPDIDPIVANVATYIESVRPVGAKVYVEAAIEVDFDISATLTLKPDYTLDMVKPKIESALDDYFKGLAFTDNTVRYSRIANLILDTEGVLDYANLTLNGGDTNIAVNEGEIPVKGVLSLVL